MRTIHFACITIVALGIGVGCASETEESVGQTAQKMCPIDDPCERPEEPPPPPRLPSFSCSGIVPGTNGEKSYFFDSPTKKCWIGPTGASAKPNGSTYFSLYTCPWSYPYLRCNVYGSCYCSAY